MLSLKISNVKKFMSMLLVSNAFDDFLLRESTIVTNASFHIDGAIPSGFYSDEDKEELGLQNERYLPYALIKNTCFDLIKGKRTPVSFKFAFLLPKKMMEEIIEKSGSLADAQAITNMFMICTYSEGVLSITSGISYQTFVLGHELDKALDTSLKLFLDKAEIDYQENA